jgi:hypothetical protein
VIAIGWSIYAAFSLLWNDYFLMLGSINVIEVIASLGLRHWFLQTREQWRYVVSIHLAASLNVIGILLVTLLMGQAHSFVPWYLAARAAGYFLCQAA